MPDWQEVDDFQLIQIAQEGDAEAFGEIYERYAQPVFRFLYAHLDNRLDAEDLTEDVFLRVWRSLGNFRQQGAPFIAFLFRIARNALIDHYRHSGQSKHHVSVEEIAVRDATPDPGEQAAASLEHQEIQEVMEQLREDYRTVLVLRFLSELSPEETALVMERSAGAVRVLQHRALAALRALLEAE